MWLPETKQTYDNLRKGFLLMHFHTIKAARLAVIGAALSACMMLSAGALYTGQTTASALNIRTEANGAIITTVPEGTKIAILSNSDSWYKVAVNGITGYASSDYIVGAADSDFTVGAGTITADDVNFRLSPSTSAPVLTMFKKGTSVSVIGIAEGWFKIEANGSTGYVHPDYVAVTGTAASPAAPVMTPIAGSSVTANAQRQAVLDFAAQFLGTPYKYGGSSPSGFDCSGFTYYVYKNVVQEIPRTASDQAAATATLTMDELLPGDLVFFRNSGSGSNVGHAGIYVGNGQFIHSPNSGDVISYDSLWSGSYNRNFISGGRVIFD